MVTTTHQMAVATTASVIVPWPCTSATSAVTASPRTQSRRTVQISSELPQARRCREVRASAVR